MAAAHLARITQDEGSVAGTIEDDASEEINHAVHFANRVASDLASNF